MAMVSSFKRFVRSFGYAASGLCQAVLSGRNLRFILCAGLTAFVWAVICRLAPLEWGLLVLTVGLVVSTELLNTAIEAVVDLTSPERHPLAKRAKDIAAAAVLVISIASLGVGAAIFGTQPSRGRVIGHMLGYWYAWLPAFLIMAAITFWPSGKIRHR